MNWLLAIPLLLLTSLTHAVTLNVSNGTLTGFSDLDVDGTLYDATLVEGSCAFLFSGCDSNSDFIFDGQTAGLAAQAMIRAIQDSAFDYNPNDIFGCTGSNCFIVVPYEVGGIVGAAGLIVRDSLYTDFVNISNLYPTDDTSDLDSYVYAKFTVSAVPVPTAVWLFGSGLIGLAGLARRKKISV